MATVNITVDQNQETIADITDATAATADLMLAQFFADGKNMFNKASVALGGVSGDVVNDNGVKYQIKVPAADALNLQGIANTYKLWKIVSGSAPTLKDSGSVTVTPLAGGADPVPSFSDAQIRNVYPGQTLAEVAALITDASAEKIYVINFYPGATIGTGWAAETYIFINFIGNAARGLDFEDADLTDGIHILSGLDVTGADFTSSTLPSAAATKLTFKDTVGKFSQTTTIWTDGDPIS